MFYRHQLIPLAPKFEITLAGVNGRRSIFPRDSAPGEQGPEETSASKGAYLGTQSGKAELHSERSLIDETFQDYGLP